MRRIRDHMDDILEARGYYRKHVAREADALARAVADVIFLSQQHNAQILSHALGVYKTTLGPVADDLMAEDVHADVRLMANLLQLPFDLLDSANPNISILRIFPTPPDQEERPLDERRELLAAPECSPSVLPIPEDKPKRGRRNKHRRQKREVDRPNRRLNDGKPILLCYSGGGQYDPVYPASMIANAAIIQSILYESLYDKVRTSAFLPYSLPHAGPRCFPCRTPWRRPTRCSSGTTRWTRSPRCTTRNLMARPWRHSPASSFPSPTRWPRRWTPPRTGTLSMTSGATRSEALTPNPQPRRRRVRPRAPDVCLQAET